MTACQTIDAPRPYEKRQSPRRNLRGNTLVTAMVRDKEYECTLIDFSTGGARVKFETKPENVKEIEISHAGLGQIAGECVWQSASFVGIRFDEAVRPQHAGPVQAGS